MWDLDLLTCGGGIHVWESTHVWRGHSRVGVTHVWTLVGIHVWELLTCGGGIHVWELLTCGGDIHVWELLTCGGDIHVWELLTCGTSHQSEILHSLIL